jgi:hypothetical protein
MLVQSAAATVLLKEQVEVDSPNAITRSLAGLDEGSGAFAEANPSAQRCVVDADLFCRSPEG